MAEEEDEREWIPLRLPPELTGKQEEAIRDFARDQGYATLRGFHWWIRREDDIWDYYDVLRALYE